MNLKILSQFIGEKNLWDKALKDFSEDEIIALVKLIGGQAVNRLLALTDIASRPSIDNLKDYWKRFGSEVESSIYSEELITAMAAKAKEFESCPEPTRHESASSAPVASQITARTDSITT